MTTLETLKAAHVAVAEQEWDDAVDGVCRLLHYDNPNFPPKHSAAVRALAKRLLTVSESTRFAVLGGGFYCTPEYDFVYHRQNHCSTPQELLEFVRYFISHEILDDGLPGVAYHRYNREWESCGPDDEGALPHFHTHVDELRKIYPDADYLSIQDALAILNEYEKDDADRKTSIENNPEMKEIFGHLYPKPSKGELVLRALAEELAAPQDQDWAPLVAMVQEVHPPHAADLECNECGETFKEGELVEQDNGDGALVCKPCDAHAQYGS